MQTIEEALNKLEKSKFRSRFSLKEKDKDYVRQKGMNVIRRHAEKIIQKRLAPAYIEKDGKQTPMKGHPVFIAQHATACCCRGCLYQWYKVPKGRKLTPLQQEKIVNLIMAWISRQMEENTKGEQDKINEGK